jgi:hypothetical protein
MILGILMFTKFGPFSSLVATVGSIMAMGAAIALGWRGRARWEPDEEDIASAPQKVGSLVAACAIALIFFLMSTKEQVPALTRIAVYCLATTVASLLVYTMLVNGLIYEKVISREKTIKIIGGLWKTGTARKAQKKEDVTTQELFAGAQYKPDKIWPRFARGLSKVLFLLGYFGLSVAGTVALGTVAVILGTK